MAMESFATPYPVTFYDGEQEHDKGQIGVHSVLTFKRFQALLSQKTGLPANQISAVFVCKRTVRDSEKRQKLPINENTNFNIILNQHNPMRERDCYFLVSIKKSKKERKGTSRRRSSEAETGDDDESISPRGGASPRDESHKIDEGASSPEVSSPLAQDLRPSFQDIPAITDQNAGRHGIGVSPERNSDAAGSDKTLLRRGETAGQISPGSFMSVGQNGHQMERQGSQMSSRQNGHRVERQRGMNSPTLDNHVLQTSQTSTQQQHEPRPLDKRPVQNGGSEERVAEKVMRMEQPSFWNVNPHPEAFQENGAVTTSPVTSAALLQRNGTLISTGNANSGSPFSVVPTSLPLNYPTPGIILSRASSGGLATGSSASLNLQQAQAHYLSLQKQHPGQVHMSPQALSRMRGAVRGLAATIGSSSGSEKASSVCRYCSAFRERNINPAPFHSCVHDRITTGFRGPSPAGPIERPVKRLEAAA